MSSCGGTEQAPAATAPPPNAKRVDAAKAGNVAGRVTFEGTPPANEKIPMGSDPVCARENSGGVSFDTVVVDNGGLENVFVYVKDGLGDYYFDVPTEAVTLDQKGCRYTPHVLGLRVGQPLEIVNSDATMHNVHAVPNVNSEFNFSQHLTGMKQQKTFTAREVMVRFKCDVHTLDERLRRRAGSSLFRRDGEWRTIPAEGLACRHLHGGSLARDVGDGEPERHPRREGRPQHHVHVQGRNELSTLTLRPV